MQLLRRVLLATSRVGAAMPASAASWVVVGESQEVSAHLDTESLRREGSRVRTWLKWNWRDEQDIQNTYPIKRFRFERQLQVSDCRTKQYAIVQHIWYSSEDGVLVSSVTVPERQWEFSEAAPETIGESIIKLACSKLPHAAK